MKKVVVGIVCACDDEIAPFISLLENYQVSQKAMLKFYMGTIEGIDIVALFSGVCKVNAAIASQILIDTYECNVIINAGTAGAIDKELKIFDTVVSTDVVYHDVNEEILTEFHPWLSSVYMKADERLLSLARSAVNKYAPDYPVVFGRMATGESFIDNQEKQRIMDVFHPLSVDMESASIAHVCYVYKIPFISIRTLTDSAEDGAQDLFEQNCLKASLQSADFVKMILREWREN